MGLSSTLAAAGQALDVFTAGLHVSGQNIANAGTPGYIREELQLESAAGYRQGNLILGTGVVAAGVQQEIDAFLEQRIYSANGDVQQAGARQLIYQQLEAELRELGTGDLSTSVNQFLASINDVANQPESAALRQMVVGEGEKLAGDIASLRSRIDSLRQAQSTRIESLVKEANALIDRIAELNAQIVRVEAGAPRSDAGTLRSQRYEALGRLSEIIPLRIREQPSGAVDVLSGNNPLVMAGVTEHLETYTDGDRDVTVNYVRFAGTQAELPSGGGELRGVLDGRDQVLGGFVDELDKYAANLVFEFNRLHSSGSGLQGFESVLSTEGLDDTSAALNDAGLNFTPVHGSFQLKVVNRLSGIAETTNIAVDLDGIGGDTSLEDLRAAIDAVDHLSAAITADGRLQIDGENNYEFRFADDTSGVLAALGINTFFTGSNSADIAVNAAVSADHNLFATGLGGGPADSGNAVRLAAFIDAPLEGLSGASLNEYYDTMASSVAHNSAKQTALTEGFDGFLNSLLNQRSQFSGVSLDEEAIKMLEFQKSYQAAARLIRTIDELFTVLLNI